MPSLIATEMPRSPLKQAERHIINEPNVYVIRAKLVAKSFRKYPVGEYSHR